MASGQSTAKHWSLRRRMVGAIVVLLAAVSMTIGLLSTVALRGYLIERLDVQISSSLDRFQSVIERPDRDDYQGAKPPDPRDPATTLPFAGIAPGAIGGLLHDGALQAVVLGQSLGSTRLTNDQAAVFLQVPRDGEIVSVDLGDNLGDYRVAAVELTNGDTAIIGLSLGDVDSTVAQLALVIAVIAAFGLAVASVVGTAIVRLALRPLDEVVATATRVSALSLERGDGALAERVPEKAADANTEVGRVAAAINRMLGHISSALTAREASERKVRTFVADASHELRTPLASIRGYAELTRRGGHELPDDVVHAMDRIESESVRMTTLVEDLLLLARLDDGRSLESHPVDLSDLLANAVSDAHAAGQDHEWLLDLPADHVVVNGDSARLHQVLTNVLANARVHTPAGTVVHASVEIDDNTAVIRIADNGPGIDDSVLPTVFERFARGDSSRSRHAGSTGLGLAIVHAVVVAHNGSVVVESDSTGTVFTVELPLTV
jgi:two-component system, OmpR family, sensor kinase